MRTFSSPAHGGLTAPRDGAYMDAPTIRPGEEIAPGLRALRLLGGGHRYEAHVAHSEHLRALVVAKVLRPGLEPAALQGMRGEWRMLRRLAHPMLLRGFGADLDGPRAHIVLELIEGPRLSTLIRRHGADLEQLLPLALNLCSVLHYLAAERVVHLDIKPRNVIMGAEPRLIDLSIARPVADLGTLRGPAGTDAYMAPEQCEVARFGELGPPADVWGLGVTLYEAIAARRPFDGRHDRWPQLRERPAPLDRRVPPALAGAVMACLEPHPPDRPTAGQLGDALEPLVGALPAPRIGRFRPRRNTPTHHHQEVPA
jgi:eukaryotic-like serine/threonine-protein kinase